MKERIRAMRKEMGMTQLILAERLNISNVHINKIESGNRNPSPKIIDNLCAIFGVNEEWLRYGTGEKYAKMSKAEEIAYISRKLMADEDPFRIAIVNILCAMSNHQLNILKDVYLELAKRLPEDPTITPDE